MQFDYYDILKKREIGNFNYKFFTFNFSDVISRQRAAKMKHLHEKQLNRELQHMIAMKMRALDGLRLELIFSAY